MRRLMMRTVAIAAVALAPTLALAQGGAGGPDRGGPESGGRMAPGGHEQGGRDQGDRVRGGNGSGQAMHGGEGRDRGDNHDRGGERLRGDNDRGGPAVRGDRERLRGDNDRGVRVDRDRERPVVERRDDRGVVERRGGERRARVVSTEQRTQIRTRVRGLGGERIHGGDFAVRVGTPLPERYRFERLPRDIVDIVPEYEGYDYVRVEDQVLIIDPETRQIIDVLD